MATAKTPKGRKIEIIITDEYGTARLQKGHLTFAGIKVAWWTEGGSGTKTLQEALQNADKNIDEIGLSDE